MTQGENAPAGWYREPGNTAQVRYWDGSRWTQWVTGGTPTPPTEATRRSEPNTLQRTGQTISQLGASITWIVLGSALLLLLLILFI